VPTEPAFFLADGDLLVPTDMARSMWSENQMHGVAISGALARCGEQAVRSAGRADLVGVRSTVDLFRAATMDPCLLTSEVVREGPRLCLVDVMLAQGGRPVARSSALFLKPTASAPGEIWSPSERASPPPEDVAPPTDDPHVPYFFSSAGWSQNFGQHQNASRKQSWNSAIPIVAGERLTGYVAAAAVADGASLVTNWGSGGVAYINTDVTLTLAREPVGTEIGLSAVDRIEQDGIAVGTVAVFDRTGPIGTAVVSSLSNAKRAIDFEKVTHPYDERAVPGA
jgi:acyl-coenzyme A thioesterase PaaI-like protein